MEQKEIPENDYIDAILNEAIENAKELKRTLGKRVKETEIAQNSPYLHVLLCAHTIGYFVHDMATAMKGYDTIYGEDMLSQEQIVAWLKSIIEQHTG